VTPDGRGAKILLQPLEDYPRWTSALVEQVQRERERGQIEIDYQMAVLDTGPRELQWRGTAPPDLYKGKPTAAKIAADGFVHRAWEACVGAGYAQELKGTPLRQLFEMALKDFDARLASGQSLGVQAGDLDGLLDAFAGFFDESVRAVLAADEFQTVYKAKCAAKDGLVNGLTCADTLAARTNRTRQCGHLLIGKGG